MSQLRHARITGAAHHRRQIPTSAGPAVMRDGAAEIVS
jgi:hypothetical protein